MLQGHSLDSIGCDSSYSPPLLVGFDLIEVEHGGRLSPMVGVGPMMVAEGDPSANACLCLRTGLPKVLVDARLLEGLPRALDDWCSANRTIRGRNGCQSIEPILFGKDCRKLGNPWGCH